MPPDDARYSFGSCEVERLRFDPQNPRLPTAVDGTDVDEVLRWMLADAGVVSLMDSIGEQGYFPGDPLLVSPVDENSIAAGAQLDTSIGDWKVVEGNRRLAAITLLTEPERAPRRRNAVKAAVARAKVPAPTDVPVVAFARRDDVLTYLGFRHITGIKEWDPLEKARFLSDLRQRQISRGEPHDNRTLARQIGSTGPYVGRLLVAYGLTMRLDALGFFDDLGGADDVPFSLLALALNYQSIVDFIALPSAEDPDQLDDLNETQIKQLATWLFVRDRKGDRTALGDSRHMKLLAIVVGSQRAVDALSNGSTLNDALLVAESPGRLVGSALGEAAARMRLAADKADDLEEVPVDAKTHLDVVDQQAATIRQKFESISDAQT